MTFITFTFTAFHELSKPPWDRSHQVEMLATGE